MGNTFAYFHHMGTLPIDRDNFISEVNETQIALVPSGPVALNTFNPFKSSLTISSVTSIVSILPSVYN